MTMKKKHIYIYIYGIGLIYIAIYTPTRNMDNPGRLVEEKRGEMGGIVPGGGMKENCILRYYVSDQ